MSRFRQPVDVERVVVRYLTEGGSGRQAIRVSDLGEVQMVDREIDHLGSRQRCRGGTGPRSCGAQKSWHTRLCETLRDGCGTNPRFYWGGAQVQHGAVGSEVLIRDIPGLSGIRPGNPTLAGATSFARGSDQKERVACESCVQGTVCRNRFPLAIKPGWSCWTGCVPHPSRFVPPSPSQDFWSRAWAGRAQSLRRRRTLIVLPHLDTPPARTFSQSSVQENPRAMYRRHQTGKR